MPIGIGTLITIGAIGAGAKAGSDIYAAHKATSASKYAATLQAQADDKQRAYLEAKDKQEHDDWLETQAETKRQFDETQRLNLQQWQAREGQLAPYRAQGEQANRTLANWLNLDGRGGASYLPTPTDYRSPATQTTIASSTPGQPSAATAFLKGLLDGGTDPQAAIAQTNEKYGLTPEKQNSAKYYGPGEHGGIPTIGLPDSYLAFNNGKWELTVRGGGGSGGTPTGSGSAPSTTSFQPFVTSGRTLADLSASSVSDAWRPAKFSLEQVAEMMRSGVGRA